MKLITISVLYNWICNDPVIDLLEKKYPKRKTPRPTKEYDLDALQTFPTKPEELTTVGFLKHVSSQVPVLNILETTPHVYHHVKKQVDGIILPTFRSSAYQCQADVILHQNVLKQIGVEIPTTYALIYMNKGLPLSTYLMFKAMLARHAFQNMMDQPVTICGCTYDRKTYSYIVKVCEVTEEWTDKFYDAVNWIRDLDDHFHEWSVDEDRPQDVRLLPNLSNRVDGWEKEKTRMAERWKELTLLCHIGSVTRSQFHKEEIYTFDDPKFFSFAKQHNINPVTELIAASLLDKRSVRPSGPFQLLMFDRTIISVDIESFRGRWYDGSPAGDTFIGCVVFEKLGYAKKHVFFNKSFEVVKEQFAKFLRDHYPDALLIHYSEADLTVIPKECQTLDVLPMTRARYSSDESFREFKFVKFGLKHVTEKLFGNMYEKCAIKNGCEASAALYHAVKYGLDTPAGQKLFAEVEEYNEVDLYALAHLYRWLIRYAPKPLLLPLQKYEN